VTDGAEIELVTALKKAAEAQGAMVEFVAPMVGGVEASDGTWIEAKQKIDGGPSVLYDAVAIVASPEGAQASRTTRRPATSWRTRSRT
jgi:catalase